MSDYSNNSMTKDFLAPRRNNYFYGKLLEESHLKIEQSYFNQKRWMLNRLGLGSGVLCGLRPCVQDKTICFTSGVLIDDCGREIVVSKKTIGIDPWTTTDEQGRPGKVLSRDEKHEVYVCLAYRECPSDYVPVLVTDCDSKNQQAPDMITEGYCLIVKEKTEGKPTPLPAAVDSALCKALIGGGNAEDKRKQICEVLTSRACVVPEEGGCVLLATVTLNANGTFAKPDACGARPMVYSNPELFEMLMCLSESESGGLPGPIGPGGPQGPAGPGIDKVEATPLECKANPTVAVIGVSPNRTLRLGIPRGCDGEPGQGLDEKLTKITELNWTHDGKLDWSAFMKGLTVNFSAPVSEKQQYDRGWFLVSLEFSGGKRMPLSTALEQLVQLMMGFVWPPGSTLVYRVAGDNIEIVKAGPNRTNYYAHFNPPPGLSFFVSALRSLVREFRIFARVVVKCDFLIDEQGRPVDGNHLDGKVPTGNGVRGGDFESWFELINLENTNGPPMNRGAADSGGALAAMVPDMAALTEFFKIGG